MQQIHKTSTQKPKRAFLMYSFSSALARIVRAERTIRASRGNGLGRAYSYYIRNN
jgi:hypothetical protein